MKTIKMGWVAMGLAVSTAITGCCGIGPSPGDKNVMPDGTVQFPATQVGHAQVLTIPMQDSANVDETITSATLTGTDASSFVVLTTFPLHVPAGTAVDVTVEFVPSSPGTSSATLVLQTAAMGPSPVDLEGDGV